MGQSFEADAYAFPSHYSNGIDDSFFNGGMSRYDYFAAHAPAIPDWFPEFCYQTYCIQRGVNRWEEKCFFIWRDYYAKEMCVLARDVELYRITEF